MSDIEAILRKAAVEIRAADLPGWGNACEWGADRIRELEAERDEALRMEAQAHERVAELEAALRRVRHAVDSTNREFKNIILEMIDQELPAETAVKPCAICGAPDDATHGLNCETTSDRASKP